MLCVFVCEHGFIRIIFELLGKCYCFIIKRKHASVLILEAERTRTLVNHHFDYLYGVALNLSMCHRVRKGEKALCLSCRFWWVVGRRKSSMMVLGRGWFSSDIFVIFLTHCVLASLFLPFNKCVTLARLTLSHRQTKML